MTDIASYDFVYEQGEDAVIAIVYSVDDAPVDLTGYSARMDVRLDGVLVYTFNTDDSDSSTDDEITVDSSGNVEVTIDRSLTLPSGELVNYIGETLTFDLFLRKPIGIGGTQKKILKGTITFQQSETLWS